MSSTWTLTMAIRRARRKPRWLQSDARPPASTGLAHERGQAGGAARQPISTRGALLGSIASPTTANYGASKAALEAWSHALRGELARFGVRVTVFVAPHTDTEMGRQVKFDGVFSLPVAYTARELVRAIDAAPRSYAGSPVYRIMLWLARLFPAFMEARVGARAARLLADDPLAPAEPTALGAASTSATSHEARANHRSSPARVP